MPPQQPRKNPRYDYVKERVRRRQTAFGKERQGDDLNGIGGDGNEES